MICSLIIVNILFFILICVLNKKRSLYLKEYYKLLRKNEELAAENHRLKVKYDEIPIVSYDA